MADDPTNQTLAALSAPLGELIAAVGRGVADAQQALDAGSLALLQQIYGEADTPMLAALRQIDYRPTFYVIPEVESEMTVAVSMTGQGSTRLYMAPVDAEYQSRYGYDIRAASKIRFKIVPVPPSTRAEQLRVVPSLVGKTWAESSQMIARSELVARTEHPLARPAANSRIVSQTPAPGSLVDAGTALTLGLAAPSIWSRTHAGTSESIYSAANSAGDGGSFVWLVGRRGLGLESLDGGRSWRPMAMGVEHNLFTVVSTPSQTVLVGGAVGTLLRRGASSSIWERSTLPFASGPSGPASINALAANERFVVAVASHGQVAVSVDDGRTWRIARICSGNLHGVAIGQDRIFAVGEGGMILESRDGLEWRAQASGVGQHLYAVSFVGGSQAYAVGESGVILRWAGDAWQALPRPTTKNLYAVWVASSGDVHAAGQSGVLLRSSDGVVFSTVEVGTTESIHAATVMVDATMLVVGTNGLVLDFR